MSLGRRLPATVVLALGFILGGRFIGSQPAQAAIQAGTGYVQVTASGPLSLIDVGQDTTLQVVDSRVSNFGEFYPDVANCTGDIGVFVTIGSTVYGPSPTAPWHCANSTMLNPTVVFQPVSQTVTGSGGASTTTVTTTVRLTSSITLTQTITYVPGNTYLTETDTLNNTGVPVAARIIDGAEPDPGSIDLGNGYHDPVSGAVGGSNPISTTSSLPYACNAGPASPYQYSVYFSPVTPWQHSVVDYYSNVWTDIGATETGASLPDTFQTGCIDPAMAVEWDVTAVTGSVSVSKTINFTSTLPVGHPGTIRGGAQCSRISGPAITCSPIAANNCPYCGSSFTFLVPASCSNLPPINLHERPCTGTMSGHIGLQSFSMTIFSGDIEPTANGGATATLHGSGFSNPPGLNGSFTITAVDNDQTAVDTVTLQVAQTTYQWTCRNVASCLEITVSG